MRDIATLTLRFIIREEVLPLLREKRSPYSSMIESHNKVVKIEKEENREPEYLKGYKLSNEKYIHYQECMNEINILIDYWESILDLNKDFDDEELDCFHKKLNHLLRYFKESYSCGC